MVCTDPGQRPGLNRGDGGPPAADKLLNSSVVSDGGGGDFLEKGFAGRVGGWYYWGRLDC